MAAFRKPRDPGRLALSAFGAFWVLVMVAPILVIVAASFNPRHIVFPPEGFTLAWYGKALGSENFVRAFLLSVKIGVVAAAASAAVALCAAVAIVRYPFRGKEAIVQALMSPLLIPTVVIGLAIYQAAIMVGIGRSFLALVIGHVIIAFPFPLRTIMANLQGTDPSLEEAAIMLGEHPVRAFFKVTFPQVRMGVAGGALLSFIVSWNNYPLSIFLSTPEFAPLPVEIFFYLQWQFEPLIAAVSSITIVFSILLIFAVERMIGLSAFTR
ncbi:MAG: ABC transporter permease [Alphaproteobacteria bacterium]|nr:ABC transporter permease [Alphaproteobacteria bacterium]